MSKGAGGTRRWVQDCPIHGGHYVLTNFMILPRERNHYQWSRRARKDQFAFYDPEFGMIDNTHLLACLRRKRGEA